MLKQKINQNTIKQKKIIFGHGSKKNKAKRDNFTKNSWPKKKNLSNSIEAAERKKIGQEILTREIDQHQRNSFFRKPNKPQKSFSFYSFYFPSKQTEHKKLNKTKTLAKKEETHFPSLIPALTQQPNRAKSTVTNEEKVLETQ